MLAADELPSHTADVTRGERIFNATGCASCHAAPNAEGSQKRVLSGGLAFQTDFGTFYAPNISSDPTAGIGAWTAAQFVSALKLGTSPDGYHYYPAFPYGSYSKMKVTDILDLMAFMETLPAAPSPSKPHDLRFPYSVRATLGGWKLFFLNDAPIVPQTDALLAEGAYLVEAMGHCGECHTPRNALGGLDTSRWLAGAPNPGGDGKVPNITPAALDWSEEDIVYYLESGFTPDYDTAGGTMVAVIENTAKLLAEDRSAIAAYLKAVPAVASEN